MTPSIIGARRGEDKVAGPVLTAEKVPETLRTHRLEPFAGTDAGSRSQVVELDLAGKDHFFDSHGRLAGFE